MIAVACTELHRYGLRDEVACETPHVHAAATKLQAYPCAVGTDTLAEDLERSGANVLIRLARNFGARFPADGWKSGKP